MPRTFPADFTTAAAAKSSAPYLILEINWGTEGAPSLKYYMGRDAGAFTAAGTRHPATIQASRVLSWGSVALDLKEGQVGGADELSIELDDTSRNLTTDLEAALSQRKAVKIYRMFDDAAVTWSGDAALVFSGSLRPFSWQLSSNSVRLAIEDAAGRMLKTVSYRASRALFPTVQEPYIDRHLPIVWGNAERVEAVPASQPYEVRTLQAIPSAVANFTVNVEDHPDDLGISALGTSGAPISVWLGDDLVTGYFTQSVDKDNTPSTFTVMTQKPVHATCAIGHYDGTGAARRGVTWPEHIQPIWLRDIFHSEVTGKNCDVYIPTGTPGPNAPGWYSTSITSCTKGDPWASAYKMQFADSNVNQSIATGSIVKVYTASANRPVYPAGTIIRPKDADWIYIANALPSKGIVKVEGFGRVPDDSGQGRDDFLVLGRQTEDTAVGEDQIKDPFTINLNDSTWAGTLGHNVTSITFKRSPRQLEQNLGSNRIFVTLDGLETARDSSGTLITNPVDVIKEYLRHPRLLNVADANIDLTSFTAAAADASITGRRCGFAQIEPASGLDILQDLARQCHCVVFFDQGKAQIKALANTAGTSQLTLDTSTNDNILLGSLAKADSDVSELVSHVLGRWRRSWDDITGNRLSDVVRSNSGVEASFGRRDIELPVYIYSKRSDVEAELDFWLTRWARVYRLVTLTGIHDALKLQPGDWVTVSYTDGQGAVLFTAQAMEVLRTVDTGPEGLVQIQARFAAFTF